MEKISNSVSMVEESRLGVEEVLNAVEDPIINDIINRKLKTQVCQVGHIDAKKKDKVVHIRPGHVLQMDTFTYIRTFSQSYLWASNLSLNEDCSIECKRSRGTGKSKMIKRKSRLEREKRESNYWRPHPSGDVQACRHACSAVACSAYEWTIQPISSQEFWHTGNYAPLLPSVYRKKIERPTLRQYTSRDGRQINTDPHKAKRRYSQITCKYCFKNEHNNRGCDKKKEAMGRGDAGISGAGAQVEL
ncbi:hypothetical protein PIB30_028121 [Stylosanthes scabra]|uniref:Uncharacterized protein n=1 Tax=Stylosanthes scabra TaxID=79078 RepID=A0ABU6U9M2_9FABA|nr:hypothetical protein [Stylosanthes scabra]